MPNVKFLVRASMSVGELRLRYAVINESVTGTGIRFISETL